MMLTSFAEMISIGAVIPFLGVLTSPEKLFESSYLQPVLVALGIDSANNLLLPLTSIFIVAVMVAGLLRLTLLWYQTRLGHLIGSDLSIQIYEKTLYQPLLIHVSRNSSELIAGISNKVNNVVGNTVLPLLIGTSSLFLLAGIFTALIWIDLVLALLGLLVFGAAYALVVVLSKRRLARNGDLIRKEYGRVVKALQEGLGAIRDVLVDGTQAVYCKIYSSADLPLRMAQANNQIIAASPRYLIEALGIALIVILAFALAAREGGATTAIPLLGALAISAQRLLPILQQLYVSWSSLRGGRASLKDVLDLIEQPLPDYARKLTCEPAQFQKSIKLNNLSFRYSDQTPWVLRDINLEIPKGSRVGFMGRTGSGKSTLLDILMALLPPSKGDLLVDEIPINEQNFRSWQLHIAHVPQSIFLADTTVAENIALGVPACQIDYRRVKKTAEQAQVAKTIESWNTGYSTVIGERGVRLSGGQRQRIGLSRAFYKEADVIFLDEATSALDDETERAVMDAIDAIGNGATVLIAAHRLSTLRACSMIYELEAGEIKRQGSYEEIISYKKIVSVR